MPKEAPRVVLLPQIPHPDPDPRSPQPSKPEFLGKLTQPVFVKEDLPKATVSTAQKIMAYRTCLAHMTSGRFTGEQTYVFWQRKNVSKSTEPEELPDSMKDWVTDYFHNWDADCSDLLVKTPSSPRITRNSARS